MSSGPTPTVPAHDRDRSRCGVSQITCLDHTSLSTTRASGWGLDGPTPHHLFTPGATRMSTHSARAYGARSKPSGTISAIVTVPP